jgi:predicted nucleic acid-binding protein
MRWLLDTNILSELRRPKPEPKVVGFVARQPLELLLISVVTLAEIRFGIEVLPDVTRRGARSIIHSRSQTSSSPLRRSSMT